MNEWSWGEIVTLGSLVCGMTLLIAMFNNPNSPNDAINKAARSITSNPLIGSREFAWGSCSPSNMFKYEIKDQLERKVGYVCTGLFPLNATVKLSK